MEEGSLAQDPKDVLFSPRVAEPFHAGCRKAVQLCTLAVSGVPGWSFQEEAETVVLGSATSSFPEFLQAMASHFLPCHGYPQRPSLSSVLSRWWMEKWDRPFHLHPAFCPLQPPTRPPTLEK